ncbi:thiamine transport system permease protein ThiP [Rodentibacter sp. JRC1]|nr:thiamine transport system permease protein ThiP [Rodentibacter sp. JRC1]
MSRMVPLFSHPHFRPRHYIGGSAVVFFIVLLYVLSLSSVFSVGGSYTWENFKQDSYLHQIITFSFEQAFLSALLSVMIGTLFGRAFFYQSFCGKRLIQRLFSLTFVLPALLAIFGLLGIYGSAGWLSLLMQSLGIDWKPTIYGLSGILIAHLFFNIPLAARMTGQALQSIPSEQHQLAAQLNIRGWQFFRLIELPYLKNQLLPAFVLIFMLCFTSFTIVLALGGGPQNSTLEVAIYQAILFEFDFPKAALFALIQFVFCFVLFTMSQFLAKPPETHLSQRYIWLAAPSSAVKIFNVFILISVCLFIFMPLLNIIVEGLNARQWGRFLQDPQLWKALMYSLSMAPTSGVLAITFSFLLLLLSRQLQWLHFPVFATFIQTAGMMILAIPTLILAVGLFLLLQDIDFTNVHLFFIVVLCNALAAMPFVIRILNSPMMQATQYYEKLCLSLNLKGWQRFKLIEYPLLKAPLKYAFALATTLSLGDFTAIALFGSPDFTSLPHLLYQQLGQYRSQEAAITALILLGLCIGLFLFIEHNKVDND